MKALRTVLLGDGGPCEAEFHSSRLFHFVLD
jgi:hypothetical protein